MAKGVTFWLVLAACLWWVVEPRPLPGEVAGGSASGVEEVRDQPAAEPPVVQFARHEELLLNGLESLRDSRLEAALAHFAQLTKEKPDFRLAQLIYGDLLLARTKPLKGIGNAQVNDPLLNALLDEARARLRYHAERPPLGAAPQPFLQVPARYKHVVAVDLGKSRLYLFRNAPDEPPQLLSDYYVSSGKNGAHKYLEGDKRTPVGLYHIVDRLSHEQLPPFYGAGALPLNYPNEWDQVLKRTGAGIWLHGSPINTYSRPPKASDGCVALTNLDFVQISNQVAVGTPVVISENLTWLPNEAWREQRELFLGVLESWRLDWNSRDLERVLSHYSPDFRTLRGDFAVWREEVRNQLEAMGESGMDVREVGIMGHPAPVPMMRVEFTRQLQDKSSGGQNATRWQLWRWEGGEWKIVFEETPTTGVVTGVAAGRGQTG